jgi:hypothetical protein
MLKKKISAILAGVMVVAGMTVSAFGASFNDTAGHWGAAAIERWADNDVLHGSNGSFNPDANMTVAELAQTISNLMNLKDSAPNTFKDVPSDAWYADAMNKCAAAGYILGDGNGIASPLTSISRERATVIMARALGIEPTGGTTTSFVDSGSTASWAAGYIDAMSKAGYINGMGNNKFAPKLQINRASVATILNNTITAYGNKAGQTVNATGSGITLIVAGDVTVTGTVNDMLIAQGAANGTVTLENATVTGKVTVNGAGTTLNVMGTSSVNSIVVSEEAEGAKVFVGALATVKTISTAAPNSNIEVAGEVGTITIDTTATGTAVVADEGGSINSINNKANSVTVSGAGTVVTVTSNCPITVTTSGTKVTITTTGGSTTSGGSSGGSGGSGGSSSSSYTYTFSADTVTGGTITFYTFTDGESSGDQTSLSFNTVPDVVGIDITANEGYELTDYTVKFNGTETGVKGATHETGVTIRLTYDDVVAKGAGAWTVSATFEATSSLYKFAADTASLTHGNIKFFTGTNDIELKDSLTFKADELPDSITADFIPDEGYSITFAGWKLDVEDGKGETDPLATPAKTYQITLTKEEILANGAGEYVFYATFEEDKDETTDQYVFSLDTSAITGGTIKLYDASDAEDTFVASSEDDVANLPEIKDGAIFTSETLPTEIIVMMKPDKNYAISSAALKGVLSDGGDDVTLSLSLENLEYDSVDGRVAFFQLFDDHLIGAGTYSIEAKFVQMFFPDDESETNAYKFTADTTVTGGKILFSKKNVDEFDAEGVTVYFIPDEDHKLASAKVTDEAGNEIVLTDDLNLSPIYGNGYYAFNKDTEFVQIGNTWTFSAVFEELTSDLSDVTNSYVLTADTYWNCITRFSADSDIENGERYFAFDDNSGTFNAIIHVPTGTYLHSVMITNYDDEDSTFTLDENVINLDTAANVYVVGISKDKFTTAGHYELIPIILDDGTVG